MRSLDRYKLPSTVFYSNVSGAVLNFLINSSNCPHSQHKNLENDEPEFIEEPISII